MLTTKRIRGQAVAVTLALAILTAGSALAQSPLGVGSAEPAFSMTGPLGGFFAWINAHQQSFYRALSASLKAMRDDPWAIGGLVGLSFAYGVFHAAGPGHGKAVISSYMLANEVALKRGIAISFVSALLQGLMAILLVGAAYIVLRGSGISMTEATRAMEIASFALIALFGAWLLLKKIRGFRMRAVTLPATAQAGTAGRTTGLNFQAVEIDDHEHRGGGQYCETCGSSHMPDPTALQARDFGLQEAWSAIVAVGLRPCSGAILVLSFSLLNSLYLGGLLSVLAMSLGTAITVALLAVFAVTAKDLALKMAGHGTRSARFVSHAVELGGAVMVLMLGLLMLGATLQASA